MCLRNHTRAHANEVARAAAAAWLSACSPTAPLAHAEKQQARLDLKKFTVSVTSNFRIYFGYMHETLNAVEKNN